MHITIANDDGENQASNKVNQAFFACQRPQHISDIQIADFSVFIFRILAIYLSKILDMDA